MQEGRGSAPTVGLPGWPLVNWRVEEPKSGKFAASAFPSYPNRREVICHQSGTDSKALVALYVTHEGHESPWDTPVKNSVMSLCVTREKKWCQRLRQTLSRLTCFQESVRVSGEMSPSTFAPPKLCISVSQLHYSWFWKSAGIHLAWKAPVFCLAKLWREWWDPASLCLATHKPALKEECCRIRLRFSWLPLYHLYNLLISFLRTSSQLSFCRQFPLYKIISPTPYKIIS